MIKRFLKIGFWSFMVLAMPVACYTWWYGWTVSLGDFARGILLPFLVIMTLGVIGMEYCIIWFEIMGKELLED